MQVPIRLSPEGDSFLCYLAPFETYMAILVRLNKFRGPDNQLTALYGPDGKPLDLTSKS